MSSERLIADDVMWSDEPKYGSTATLASSGSFKRCVRVAIAEEGFTSSLSTLCVEEASDYRGDHEKQEQVREWLQSLGIVDHVAVVQDDDEPDYGAIPLHHEGSSRNRNVPSSAVFSILHPTIGGQQIVSGKAKVAMQGYLNHFLGNLDIVNSREVCKFLEVSKLSFSREYGPKLKEGYVTVKHLSKADGDDDIGCFPCQWFSFCTNNWRKVWAVMKPGFMALLEDPFDTKLLDIIVFDVLPTSNEDVKSRVCLAEQIKEHNPLYYTFRVSCGSWSMDLRVTSDGKAKEWVAFINDAGIGDPGGWCYPHRVTNKWEQEGGDPSEAMAQENDAEQEPGIVESRPITSEGPNPHPYVTHRFGSFAPPRGLNEDGSQAQWFVDGRAAFEAIATSIEKAKSEIFITGWWLCPELYLRRPFRSNPSSRLDALLEAKAKQGVQIYILLYKEVSIALKISSMYSKKLLHNIHENVRVLRYPDHLSTGVYLWSHHEKLVTVNYQICFIGGLDLCFGRYDTVEHRVGDCPRFTWPGKDYYNPRESEPNSWEESIKDELERGKYPRMPWHDVHCALWGPPCRDVARHFVQRWNHAKRNKALHEQTIPLLMPQHHMTSHRFCPKTLLDMDIPDEWWETTVTDDNDASVGEYGEIGPRIACHCQVIRSVGQWSAGTSRTEESIHRAYCSLIEQAEHFIYIEVLQKTKLYRTGFRKPCTIGFFEHTKSKNVFEFAHSLRCSLWSEHLGLHPGEISKINDPVLEQTYRKLWLATAESNTKIFQDVFACIPNDLIHSRTALRQDMAYWKDKLGHTTIDLGEREFYASPQVFH
ncbi:phospholipase D P2, PHOSPHOLIPASE D ZETA 2 [Hibiscus trionum]|uniref:phospholipase D n=1 Tax=Hibiscus trionum TaxID=183268 RepID=A0A9W7HL24_HIBTR|nr:phospholipase D P2, PHOSPHOLIPASE D ZETA 2 [Hibiscus trionum]